MKETMTGNRAIFKIAGTVIGVAQNVEVSDDFGLQEVDGLGNLEVQEYVPGKLTHRISGSSYFVVNQNLRQLNLVPESGDWLSSPEFEVEIQDALTYSTVESYVAANSPATAAPTLSTRSLARASRFTHGTKQSKQHSARNDTRKGDRVTPAPLLRRGKIFAIRYRAK